MSTPTLTRLFALGRVAYGVGLLATPEKVASPWIGADAGRDPVKVTIRGLGARDIALSAGALAFAADPDRVRPWLLGAAACDCADIAATLAGGERLPDNARAGTVALAGVSAVIGLALAWRAG